MHLDSKMWCDHIKVNVNISRISRPSICITSTYPYPCKFCHLPTVIGVTIHLSETYINTTKNRKQPKPSIDIFQTRSRNAKTHEASIMCNTTKQHGYLVALHIAMPHAPHLKEIVTCQPVVSAVKPVLLS